MASPTKVHKRQKILKGLASGKWRKNQMANKGTTAPDLALDKPNENELKQTAARGKKLVKSVKTAPKTAAKAGKSAAAKSPKTPKA